MDVGAELDALGDHLLQPPVEHPFFHLELGDAVAQQSADAVGLLEHRHRMPGAIQLLSRGQSRRSRADDGHALAGSLERRFRPNPAFAEPVLDDLLFDDLDRHRRLVDAQHAGGFARRRADAAGELRKIVGGVQRADRLAPVVAVHQIVPIRNHVVQRTAVVAKRHAAIHATRALGLNFLVGKILVNLEPVVDTFGDRAALRKLARVFEEARDFTHARPLASRQVVRCAPPVVGGTSEFRARAYIRAGRS